MAITLNDQQYEAVFETVSDSTIMIAGAGSGKTRVIKERVAHIIKDLSVPPEKMIVTTFTNKAADEIRSRLESDGIPTQGMFLGTFHSICLRFLKMFGYTIGLNGFSVMDTYEARDVLVSILKAKKISWSSANDITDRLATISGFKNNFISSRLALSRAVSAEEIEIAEIYRDFQSANWNNRMLDFDDLIVLMVTILISHEHVREWFYNNISHIMIDETQDCNAAQYMLIGYWNQNANLFMVGDDDQSIYGFRNAKPDQLLNYSKVIPNINMLYLEQNYRSTKTIVDASSAVIAHNKNRFKKKCFSKNEEGSKINYITVKNDEEQARTIARYINKEVAYNSRSYSDFAILYRTNRQSRTIEDAFASFSIPYNISGGLQFFDRKEVKDLCAFIHVLANPRDTYAFTRAFSLFPRVGKAKAEYVIKASSSDCLTNLWNVQLNDKAFNDAQRSMMEIVNFVYQYPQASVAEFLTNVCNTINYKAYLASWDKDSDGAQERADNVDELIIAVSELCDKVLKETGNQATFMDVSAMVSGMTKVEAKSSSNFVSLMTVHSAKGLEFHTVFIIGADQGILPSYRAIDNSDIEEERRLMYVAMTRAKKRLIISHCKTTPRREPGKEPIRLDPSEFISEIPSRYIIKGLDISI